MDQEKNKVIPENIKGKETDTLYGEDYRTLEEAKTVYSEVKERLLNISQWHSYAGKGTADFQLTDSNGNRVTRLAQQGDHFRIDIPGPGSTTGDGYDWVEIKSVTEDFDSKKDLEYTAILVRPATNPNNSNEDVAHFFKGEASSTFIVLREGLHLSAEVHGRNEQPNTNAENLIDKARNVLVATGAMLGFSDVQWKSLVKGLIKGRME